MANDDYTQWEKQFRTPDDALEDDEETQYLVDKVIVLPSLNILFGSPGCLKTNLLLDMALCVASGKKWLTELPGNEQVGYNVLKSPVIWIDVDSGMSVLNKRIAAMTRARELKKGVQFKYASFLTPPFIASNTKAVAYLTRMITKHEAKLVVFDNLATISGAVDENSNQMIGIMNNLRAISGATGAAVIVIHHDTKNDNGSTKTSRGHSSIRGAVDLELHAKREDDIVNVYSVKNRNEPVDPFSALWTYEADKESRRLQTARFFGVESEEETKYRAMDEVILSVIVKQSKANQSEIIDACANKKISRGKCLSRLQTLERKGKIKSIPNQQRNQKVYHLP